MVRPTRHQKDVFTKRARGEGFPARSVYKLEEIDRRTKLLRGGQRVLELGASPGSWAKYVSQRIGPSGTLVAVDLNPLREALSANCHVVQGDAREMDDVFKQFAPFHVVLSDMAPETSGQRAADQYRSFELYMLALETSSNWLRSGGAFVGKIFTGAEFEAARKHTRALFRQVRVIKPRATRKESYELFLVAQGRKEAGPSPADV